MGPPPYDEVFQSLLCMLVIIDTRPKTYLVCLGGLSVANHQPINWTGVHRDGDHIRPHMMDSNLSHTRIPLHEN